MVISEEPGKTLVPGTNTVVIFLVVVVASITCSMRCVCVCTHVPWEVDRGCGGQRATYRDWFSLSPWKFQELNSGHSALLADPSDWPLNLLLLLLAAFFFFF